MKELTDLLKRARRLREAGEPFTLATVVKVMGSAYRRPGARMLVTPVGAWTGTISGGCLEGEVARQAIEVLETGAPRVVPFEMHEDDHIMGFGTGCGGDVHVLLEPVPMPGRPAPTDLLDACFESRNASLIATLIDVPDGHAERLGLRLVRFADGRVQGDLDAFLPAVRDDAQVAFANRRPEIRTYPTPAGEVQVLFEVLRPPIRLVVFGDGHDVAPLVRLAGLLGWDVTVVGRRTADELAVRFPEADDHVFLMHPREVADYVAFDAWTAAVVMTHAYLRDRTLVRELLNGPTPYVGALGPRHRTERILEELEAEGATFTENQRARLHGPVGLDIGTETPEEIALSICAEVQAVFHGRDAGRLREREGAIHETVVLSS